MLATTISIAAIAIAPLGNAVFGATPEFSPKPRLTYCIPLSRLDLSPFEDLDEPVRLFYLLLMTRSFISTDPDEPGVLAQWQFSPDGRTLIAKVSRDAKWQDGSRLSAREAAYSIARGLSVHPVGERVRVAGTESIHRPGWTKRSYSGVKVKDDDTFELRFESSITNIAGVVREALSTNARANRIWAARLVEDNTSQLEIISKFPYRWDGHDIVVDAGVATVRIYPNTSDCSASDFRIYGIPQSEMNNFTSFSSYGQQTLFGVIRPAGKLASREKRLEVARWLRRIFTQKATFGFTVLKSHFGRLETGYTDVTDWGLSDAAPELPKLVITKGTNYTKDSPIVTAISEATSSARIPTAILNQGERAPEDLEEIVVAGARIEGDRQLWMQDHLNDPLFKDIMPLYPKSTAALSEVAKKSSSTIPVDRVTLEALDKALLEEVSIIPLARYRVTVFSRSTSPIELIYTQRDEMSFRVRTAK